jgi:2-(1,2-epoxy-1,2-dihydrophenyl)acetyl-CoA isomerase
MSVRYELDRDVAVITLDRPDRFNAIDQALADGVIAGLDRAAGESRAVVITGAGKAFCSGADLADLKEEYGRGEPDLEALIRRRFNPLIEAVLDAPLPVLAAVNGAAAGAGMGLALACDLRVMADTAFLMSAFINVALIPDSGSAWFLAHMVGVSRALEITYTGRRVSADEAAGLGLAHRVVPAERVLEEAKSWAAELADGPKDAYVATRRLVRSAAASPLAATLEEEARLQGELGRRRAHLEGMSAFLEKRKPDFRAT